MDHALEFVTRKRSEPFFLWLAQKAPHAPCTPLKHLETLYDDVDLPKPATYNEDRSDNPAWFVEQHDHDAFHLLMHPNARYQKYVKDYCRTITSVDVQLGRLLKTFDEKGLTGNTVIIHLADNGHFLGHHQLYSKMLMYEESIRIPLIVQYPGFAPAGRMCDEMVLNLDHAPTILDLARAAMPKDMKGRSVRDLIAGKRPREWRRWLRCEYDCSTWGLPDLDPSSRIASRCTTSRGPNGNPKPRRQSNPLCEETRATAGIMPARRWRAATAAALSVQTPRLPEARAASGRFRQVVRPEA